MESVDGLDTKTVEYYNNNDLTEYRFRRFSMSHSRYVLSQLESDNNLNRVSDSLEPIAIRAKAQTKISTGFLSSHTHYVELYLLNVDRMRELAAGNDPPPRMTSFDAELLANFCDTDHDSAMEYYWEIEKWLRKLDTF
jgi:hypothetical protein